MCKPMAKGQNRIFTDFRYEKITVLSQDLERPSSAMRIGTRGRTCVSRASTYLHVSDINSHKIILILCGLVVWKGRIPDDETRLCQ